MSVHIFKSTETIQHDVRVFTCFYNLCRSFVINNNDYDGSLSDESQKLVWMQIN